MAPVIQRLSAVQRSPYEVYTRTIPYIFQLSAALILLSLGVVMGARRWLKELRRRRMNKRDRKREAKGKQKPTKDGGHGHTNSTTMPVSPWIAPPDDLPLPQCHPFFASKDIAPQKHPPEPLPYGYPVAAQGFSPPTPAEPSPTASAVDVTREIQATDIAGSLYPYPMPTIRRYDIKNSLQQITSLSAVSSAEPVKKLYARRMSFAKNEAVMVHGEVWQQGDRDNGWRRNIWVVNR